MRWLLLVLLAGCSQQEPEYLCVRSHTEQRTVLVPMMVGKILINMPQTQLVTVCDSAVPNPKYEKPLSYSERLRQKHQW